VKIIHIITGLNDGGAEGVLYRLCKHDNLNNHLVVSIMDSGKYGPMLEAMGVTVTTLNMSPGRPSPIAFIRLLQLLLRQKPDIVQTWMYHADLFGGLTARMAGVSTVFWGIRQTTFKTGISKKSTVWIVQILAKLSWYVPSRIVVCAQQAIDVHEALGYDRRIMHFIPNGYDLESLRPDLDPTGAFKDKIKTNQTAPLIGMVGRFDAQKDHANLLDALIILYDRGINFRCVLVGTGLNSSNYEITKEILQRNLEDHVHLLGQRNDIPIIMNAIDIHVLSSESEGFPNVVCEAMACGTPCVVTDVGDAAYIVGDTGWVVPPSDPVALSIAIEEAIMELSGPYWQNRTQAARNRIQENFSIERMVNEYNRLWNLSLEQ
jgi:glycosyltransferase involved in cell wall biosynthesis